jgi:hypothetical protein
VPAQGALEACLTGLVNLTSTRIYDLHYSTYTLVPGSVSIHILRTVVLDYGELLAYWFILHPIVVNNGDWYDNDDHDDVNGNCYNNDNYDNNRRKGVGSEPAAAAAEAVAVATAGADNNQQRAAKTAAVAIAVGKRCQARGEKRRQRQDVNCLN